MCTYHVSSYTLSIHIWISTTEIHAKTNAEQYSLFDSLWLTHSHLLITVFYVYCFLFIGNVTSPMSRNMAWALSIHSVVIQCGNNGYRTDAFLPLPTDVPPTKRLLYYSCAWARMPRTNSARALVIYQTLCRWRLLSYSCACARMLRANSACALIS